jgi:hypothetical protein
MQAAHSVRCIERSCRLKHNADHFAVGVEGAYIVTEILVLAAMTFILVAVVEQVAMKLLNVAVSTGRCNTI